MGMFDDIIVPKSYLRGLLTKENEKLLHKDHVFQTKDFDNLLDVYKIYRQRLYKIDRSGLEIEEGAQHTKLTDKWNKVHEDKAVIFYDQVNDDEDNEHWFEFEFTFNNGKLDKKKLLSVKIETTAKERGDINKMWDLEQKIFDEYRDNNTLYKLYTWLEKRFQKMTNWARNKHRLPIEIRKEAYEKSGRLKKDPKALDLYLDV
jgi:hypothetical protein